MGTCDTLDRSDLKSSAVRQVDEHAGDAWCSMHACCGATRLGHCVCISGHGAERQSEAASACYITHVVTLTPTLTSWLNRHNATATASTKRTAHAGPHRNRTAPVQKAAACTTERLVHAAFDRVKIVCPIGARLTPWCPASSAPCRSPMFLMSTCITTTHSTVSGEGNRLA